jgi:hypothetical protein
LKQKGAAHEVPRPFAMIGAHPEWKVQDRKVQAGMVASAVAETHKTAIFRRLIRIVLTPVQSYRIRNPHDFRQPLPA